MSLTRSSQTGRVREVAKGGRAWFVVVCAPCAAVAIAACVDVDDRIFRSDDAPARDASMPRNDGALTDGGGADDGSPADAAADASSPIVMNEIVGAAPDYVELRNVSSGPVELTGYKLAAGGGKVLALSGVAPAGAYIGVMASDDAGATGQVPCDPAWGFPSDLLCFRMGEAIKSGGETITFTLPDGRVVTETSLAPIWGRLPDTTGPFGARSTRTPGVGNVQ